MADPVSIRTNNPGAQWFGPVARQFGSTGTLSGLPGGNNAAMFPDPVSGAAAQFALLRNGYAGMPLSDAIAKWSGHNDSAPYAAFVAKNTGLAPDTKLTPEFLSGPGGVALAKAQAQWEAGKPYPLTDEQWAEAQGRAYGGSTSDAPTQAASPSPSPPLDAAAVGQSQAVPAPYFAPSQPAPTSPQPSDSGSADPFGGLLSPMKLGAVQPIALPPAWRPPVPLTPSTLGTLRAPFYSRG